MNTGSSVAGGDTRDAADDGHLPRDGRYDNLGHPLAFVVRQQRCFAGVDRRHDAVRAGVDAKPDAAFQRGFVDVAQRVEACHRDREDATPRSCHGHAACHGSAKSVKSWSAYTSPDASLSAAVSDALSPAGFELCRAIPTAAPLHVIEGVAAAAVPAA